MRRGTNSIVANPVLVGAVTTLVVVVAVFLAYNANNGLPFVPTRTLFVNLDNGAEVVPGNEVREGGFRVGVVQDMVPKRLPDGTVGAQLKLKLDRKVGDLPTDSRVVVRQRSSLGLKYIQLEKGSASKTFPDGATLPRPQTVTPVDLDQVYNTFDTKTRAASAENLVGFGDTFTGRSEALNSFITQAPGLFKVLQPVMANLADDRTQLGEFFNALNRTASTVAPVAKIYAGGFKQQADTFAAIDRDPQALKDTITKSPPTMEASVRSFRVNQPFLDDTTAFSRDLHDAARELAPTLPVVNQALEIGTPVQRRSVKLNQPLQEAMGALRDLAKRPSTNAALFALTDTVATLQPQLRYLGPYITVCNTWNTFWTLAAEHLSSPIPTGTAERAMLNNQGQQDNSVGSQGAVLPAAGLNVKSGDPQFLHLPAGPSAIMPDGSADCEGGQQGYPSSANPFTELKNPNYKHVVVDVKHSEEASGPNYKQLSSDGDGHTVGVGRNLSRVPPGETFTAQPGGKGAQIETP